MWDLPMPIYEFACPKCRVIFNFLSKRLNPEREPVCPKCGNRNDQADEPFCHARGSGTERPTAGDDEPMPDIETRMERV
jgi:putative FmdB family regulatory protein